MLEHFEMSFSYVIYMFTYVCLGESAMVRFKLCLNVSMICSKMKGSFDHPTQRHRLKHFSVKK